jgi:hypothetical protein
MIPCPGALVLFSCCIVGHGNFWQQRRISAKLFGDVIRLADIAHDPDRAAK